MLFQSKNKGHSVKVAFLKEISGLAKTMKGYLLI